jgi:HAD superfamily hydrolase (TIGR01509 family)
MNTGRRKHSALGVIFDWDGVIIDSAPQHLASWELLAAEERRPLPEGHFRRGFGLKNGLIIPEILGWTRDPKEIDRLSLRKEVLYRECLQKTALKPLAGVRRLLAVLHDNEVPCVVGSSTERKNITSVLGRLELEGYFSGLVTGEDVVHGKPDPEVFLKAAAVIDQLPHHCVVVEDSEPGLQAARAGGMYALGVATTRPRSELHSAHCVVESLDRVSLDDLIEMISSIFGQRNH